jgi:hypothetical protein
MYRQLHGNSGNEFAVVSDISRHLWEKEASCELSPIEVGASDGVRDCRLFCASHTTQPKDALLVFTISAL